MIPYLIDQHNKGQYPLEKLIVDYDIPDSERAIKDMRSGSTIKAVLKRS